MVCEFPVGLFCVIGCSSIFALPYSCSSKIVRTDTIPIKQRCQILDILLRLIKRYLENEKSERNTNRKTNEETKERRKKKKGGKDEKKERMQTSNTKNERLKHRVRARRKLNYM